MERVVNSLMIRDPSWMEVWLLQYPDSSADLVVMQSPLVQPQDECCTPLYDFMEANCLYENHVETVKDPDWRYGRYNLTHYTVFATCPGLYQEHICAVARVETPQSSAAPMMASRPPQRHPSKILPSMTSIVLMAALGLGAGQALTGLVSSSDEEMLAPLPSVTAPPNESTREPLRPAEALPESTEEPPTPPKARRQEKPHISSGDPAPKIVLVDPPTALPTPTEVPKVLVEEVGETATETVEDVIEKAPIVKEQIDIEKAMERGRKKLSKVTEKLEDAPWSTIDQSVSTTSTNDVLTATSSTA